MTHQIQTPAAGIDSGRQDFASSREGSDVVVRVAPEVLTAAENRAAARTVPLTAAQAAAGKRAVVQTATMQPAAGQRTAARERTMTQVAGERTAVQTATVRTMPQTAAGERTAAQSAEGQRTTARAVVEEQTAATATARTAPESEASAERMEARRLRRGWLSCCGADELRKQGINAKGYGVLCKLPMLDRELTIEAKGIYCYICSFAGSDSTAFPSRERILADLQMCKDAYYKHYQLLLAQDYLRVTQKNVGGNSHGFLKNVYEIADRPAKFEGRCDNPRYEAAYARIRTGTLQDGGFGFIPRAVMVDRRLSVKAKALYGYYRSFAGAGDGACPEKKDLLYHLGISAKLLEKLTAELVSLQYITLVQRRVNGRLNVNDITLNNTPGDGAPCCRGKEATGESGVGLSGQKQDTQITSTQKQEARKQDAQKQDAINKNSRNNNEDHQQFDYQQSDLSGRCGAFDTDTAVALPLHSDDSGTFDDSLRGREDGFEEKNELTQTHRAEIGNAACRSGEEAKALLSGRDNQERSAKPEARQTDDGRSRGEAKEPLPGHGGRTTSAEPEARPICGGRSGADAPESRERARNRLRIEDALWRCGTIPADWLGERETVALAVEAVTESEDEEAVSTEHALFTAALTDLLCIREEAVIAGEAVTAEDVRRALEPFLRKSEGRLTLFEAEELALDEFREACRTRAVRNPLAYLKACIWSALRSGDGRILAAILRSESGQP